MRFVVLVVLFCVLNACTTTFYVVRHAEKEAGAQAMSGDVPLSADGRERAQALKERLNGKVSYLASTNTKRTTGTAEPLSVPGRRNVHVYSHTDTVFLQKVKEGRVNTLIVGHSNTVDDVVNFLAGRRVLSDLPDTAYGDLFIVRKKGKTFSFSRERFGK